MNTTSRKTPLCWSHREMVEATEFCYRPIINLEVRGLLQQVPVGVNVAANNDLSVQTLFGAKPAQKEQPA